MYQPTTIVSLLLALTAASQPSVRGVPVSAHDDGSLIGSALVKRVAATGGWAEREHTQRAPVSLPATA